MNIHGIQSVGTLTQVSGGFATLTGSFTGSFKGDGSELTGINVTASFDSSSLVTTASFNSYTQSTNSRLSSLESATSSYAISSSVKTVTDGLQTQINGLATTSSVNSISTSVGLLQTFSGSQYKSDSSSFDSRLDAIEGAGYVTSTITGSVLISASFNNGTRNLTFTKGDASTFNVNIPDASGSSGNFVTTSSFNAYTASTDGRLSSLESATGSYTLTSSFNSYTSSTDGRLNSIESKTGSFATTGSNTFVGVQRIVNDASITGSLGISGSELLVGTIQVSDSPIGPQWYGGVVYQGVGTTAVAYDQFVNGGNYDSLHIESQLNNGTLFQDYDGSNVSTWMQIPANPGTNPPPQFKRGLGITGSLSVTGSTSFSELTGSLASFSASVDSRIKAATGSGTPINTGSFATTGSNNFVGNQTITGSLILSSSAAIELTVIGNEVVSGNLDISGNLTASLQQGYVWVGGAGNRTVTVATSSFGGGGATFPFTGSAVITGSLLVTGSQWGNVVALTVSSGTASLDMSLGNSFTLTLPSSSTTHINPTNIRPGATLNLLITQPATSGAVSFPSSVKFQNGVDYQASATGSAIDLISFATFDSTNVYATAIKNLL